MSPKIIGITGKTGAGKTTLAQDLASVLETTLLCWDDFDSISQGPDDYVDWYNRGQNYEEWNYQALAEVLKTLKSNHSMTHPTLNILLNPTKYIFFDAPLGKLHKQTGQYIDICIHIDVPLDVCLSRRIIRDFKANNKTKDELIDELEFYLSQARPLFFDDDLKNNADFIIDGMFSTKEQTQKVKRYLITSTRN